MSSQPIEQPQIDVAKEEVKVQSIEPDQALISEPQRPLLKIAKYIVEDDGAPKQAEGKSVCLKYISC